MYQFRFGIRPFFYINGYIDICMYRIAISVRMAKEERIKKNDEICGFDGRTEERDEFHFFREWLPPQRLTYH